MRQEKGITLLALVVTVIVLIILAAVSINLILGDDGIVTKARDAASKYANAAAYENEQLANVNAYASNIGSEVTAPYNNPYIPNGFTHTEGTWNNGFTIKNNVTNDEFVWVPCTLTATNETVAFKRITTDEITYTTEYNPYNPDNNSGFSDEGTTASEIRTSVGIYGGFYIAKYEASESSGSARSVPNAMPWVSITRENAMAKSEAMVNASNGVKSALISGECWDTTLQWMVNKSDNRLINAGYDIDSTGKGWYQNVDPSNPWSLTGTGVDSSNSNKVNNIWDMAGNVWEWTTDNSISSYSGNVCYHARGGCFLTSASQLPASFRTYFNNGGTNLLGFRAVIYK